MKSTALIINFALLLLLSVSAQKRVINGWNAKPYSLPYIVTASTEKDGHFCGGSLLDRKTVLTAAHCSSGKPEDIMVSVHRHNLTKSSDEEKGFTTVLSKMINHPKYDEQNLSNDVAVWILKNPIPEDIEVAFVKLADNEQDEDANLPVLTAAGWGLSDYKKGVMPPILQKASLKAISRKECTEGWKNEPIDLSHSLCTLSVNKKQSICNGDSGGPLAYKQGEDYIQVGLVSFGEVECELKNKKPDGFIRVASYKSWIEKQQKNNKKSYLVGHASGFVKKFSKKSAYLADADDEIFSKNKPIKKSKKLEVVLNHNDDHLVTPHTNKKAKSLKKDDVIKHDDDHLTSSHTNKKAKSVVKGASDEVKTNQEPTTQNEKIQQVFHRLNEKFGVLNLLSRASSKLAKIFSNDLPQVKDELLDATNKPNPKIITNRRKDNDFSNPKTAFIS